MHLSALMDLINERHGTRFELGARYATGEQGAYAITDAVGRRFVLKWSGDASGVEPYREAGAVTAALRAVGYPAPRYCLVGAFPEGSYAIQDALPGVTMGVLTQDLLPGVLDLNELQEAWPLSGPRDWPARVVDTVLAGGDGYCLLGPLRTYSPATAELLARLQTLVTAHADDECEADHVVHFDFQPTNILVDGGTISGVVDWEGACSGDRAFDLVTLLFYCYDAAPARDRLWREVVDRVRPGVLSVYLAHLILRQVDWSIRHHDRPTVDRYLHRAAQVLRDLSSLTGRVRRST